MAVLKKEQVVNLLTKASQPEAFILCKYLEHNGALNLCCNTDTAPVTDYTNGRFIGRVSSRIFDWFTWEVLDRPALNVVRYKYAGPKPSKDGI